MKLTQGLKQEYLNLFSQCWPRDDKLDQVLSITSEIVKAKSRYQDVSNETNVPWYVVALLHHLESQGDFAAHLHNGDPLTAKTIHVPHGRPSQSEPPFTWEHSAADALVLSGITAWTDWTVPGLLFKLEGHNGWGYRKYHPEVKSPYLWASSNLYASGEYDASGRFDPQKISNRYGAAVLLKILFNQGKVNPSSSPAAQVTISFDASQDFDDSYPIGLSLLEENLIEVETYVISMRENPTVEIRRVGTFLLVVHLPSGREVRRKLVIERLGNTLPPIHIPLDDAADIQSPPDKSLPKWLRKQSFLGQLDRPAHPKLPRLAVSFDSLRVQFFQIIREGNRLSLIPCVLQQFDVNVDNLLGIAKLVISIPPEKSVICECSLEGTRPINVFLPPAAPFTAEPGRSCELTLQVRQWTENELDLDAAITISNADGEALLQCMYSGSIGAAQTISDELLGKAYGLMYHKFDHLTAACVAGYFAMMTRQWQYFPHDWCLNLSDSFPYISDGAILYAKRLESNGLKTNVEPFARYLFEAAARGLPTFSKGLQILLNSAVALRNTAPQLYGEQCQRLLDRFSPIAQSCDFNKPFTTITGATLDTVLQPLLEPHLPIGRELVR